MLFKIFYVSKYFFIILTYQYIVSKQKTYQYIKNIFLTKKTTLQSNLWQEYPYISTLLRSKFCLHIGYRVGGPLRAR